MPWLWVVLLPFIDEDRLLSALGPSEKDWSETENKMNERGLGDGYLFVHKDHPLATIVTEVMDKKSKKKDLGDASKWGGFTGEGEASAASWEYDNCKRRAGSRDRVVYGRGVER